MAVRSALFSVLAGLSVATAAWAEPTAGSDTPSGEPGAWRSQKVEFVYMGFTSTYSCDGLQSKLELLLRQLGAKPGFKVNSYGCDRGPGRPSRFARATVEFSALQPTDGAAASDSPITGSWRAVELSPNHPFDLQDGDCELLEQFRDKILPLFAIRALQARVTCVPHQDTGGPFDLQLQVFVPLK
jgi:hypothetical protein